MALELSQEYVRYNIDSLKILAEELKESGTSKARSFENVSVLFTDFADFTKLTEKMPE